MKKSNKNRSNLGKSINLCNLRKFKITIIILPHPIAKSKKNKVNRANRIVWPEMSTKLTNCRT